MGTGRSCKIVGQTGEYLVAAELSRRGLIATTFTGNVPHYDIIASNEAGRHVSVQVKAGRFASWQLNIGHFCNITFHGKRQIVGAPKRCPVRGLVVVFVKIEDDRSDQFFICDWQTLRNLLIPEYKAYLKKHHGVRPKRPDSLHTVIDDETLMPYLDNWGIIRKRLR